MLVTDAMNQRHSVRGFTNEPVDQKTLKEILTLASRSISGVNSQPWEFAVVTGPILDEIKKSNTEAFQSNALKDRVDPQLPSGIYTDRSKVLGKALLSAMKITREDRTGRTWWAERGYRFFDAPAVIFLLMDAEFDEGTYRFDMGCAAMSICLASMEYGLGTCVADQAVTYQQKMRELLHIPKNKHFIIGIAIGHSDPGFPANQVISEREDVENLTSWYGFSH